MYNALRKKKQKQNNTDSLTQMRLPNQDYLNLFSIAPSFPSSIIIASFFVHQLNKAN